MNLYFSPLACSLATRIAPNVARAFGDEFALYPDAQAKAQAAVQR